MQPSVKIFSVKYLKSQYPSNFPPVKISHYTVVKIFCKFSPKLLQFTIVLAAYYEIIKIVNIKYVYIHHSYLPQDGHVPVLGISIILF